MTTTVTTKSAQVLTRTWNDLDPKVRNALAVLVLTIPIALAIAGFGTKSFNLSTALTIIGPVFIAVFTAYVTTSKHKELVINAIDDGDAILHSVAPLASRVPAVAPFATAVEGAADALKDAVDHPDTPPPVPSLTAVLTGTDSKADAPTQAYTLNDKAKAFLGTLPSTNPQPALDGH